MDAPLWILRQLILPYGRKLPARPKEAVTRGAQMCSVCKYEIRESSVYRGERWYHKWCDPLKQPARFGAYHPWYQRDADEERVKQDGNLGTDEYRFWIGSIVPGSDMSICRACQEACYSPADRLAHKGSVKARVKGMACTTQLTNAYKELLATNKCVVCRETCYTAKWGIPLCFKGDCLDRWKFNTTPWVNLTMALFQQRKDK